MGQGILDDMSSYFDKVASGDGNKGSSSIPVPVSNVMTTAEENKEKFYRALESHGFNMDEMKAILESDNHTLVLSGAGAGKTTVLVFKLIKDFITGTAMNRRVITTAYGEQEIYVPAKILVSTFLKSGAEEIGKSFREWCNKLGVTGIDTSTIQFRTIHAEVRDAISQMGVGVSLLEDTSAMIKGIMGKYGIRSVQSMSRNITVEEVNDITAIVAFARNRLDEKRYEQILMGDYRLDSLLLDRILSDFKIFRQSSGKIDFEDMQEMLYEALLMNQSVREFIASRYDFVYIDEFQDTSQLQYEILKAYFAGAKRVMTIGDDDQTIYSWRGSDIDIITSKFEADIRPTVLKLTTNYRCRKVILDAVIPSIELNTNRHPKELKAYKEGGELAVVPSSDVNLLVKGMRADLGNGLSVGVIARVNNDLLIPAMLLEIDGGIDYLLSKAVTLRNRLPRQIFGVIDLVTKRYTDEFEGYFKMFVPRGQWREAGALATILANNRGASIYNLPISDLKQSVPGLYPLLNNLRVIKDTKDDVNAYIYILNYMLDNVFAGKGSYASKARDLINFTLNLLISHEKVSKLTIAQLDELLNRELPERIANRVKYNRDVNVKLTTVHEAKGKEWGSVYIWNDIEGSFPANGNNRDLTDEEYEEERRVHYIAWTRAKDKLTVFTDLNKMSPFLKECNLTNATGIVVTEKTDTQRRVHQGTKQPDEMMQKSTEVFIREYINNIHNNSGSADERYVNLTIVLETNQVEELVTIADGKYGLMFTGDKVDTLDLMFREIADSVYNGGQFR